MKKKIFILLFIGLSLHSFSQKQTAFWYFGSFAGLDFNSGNPIALTDGQVNTEEGCTAISNFNGELLFYTDGITIWNKNHEIMLNGDNLNGHNSSTNSAIIIPKPDTINVYYVFTVDQLARSNGLQYSTVNMLLDGGLGSVTSEKNRPLHTPTTEKITAVKHQNDIDWWVLTHKWDSDEFAAYLVTSSGISSPIISSIGTNLIGDIRNTVGAMKFSPDGTKIAIANSYENRHVQLFDFNDTTGIVSNPITLPGYDGEPTTVYGVEFSLDSKLVYATDHDGSIYQYNVDLPTPSQIINSRIEIANDVEGLSALQLAPNGKIYVAKNNSQFLGVIANPNVIGVGCNYIDEGVFLGGRTSKRGLPPFIQSYFWREIAAEYTCFGETTQFTLANPENIQSWNFGDPSSGTNNSSSIANPTHTFSSPGVYTVNVVSTNILGEQSNATLEVIISEIPVATQPEDYVLCDNSNDDDNQNGIIQSFLLATKDSEILGTLDTNQYNVLYFENIDFTINIPKDVDYENTIANSQLVYAKVYNLNDGTCFDAVEFNLIVKDVPIYDVEDEKVVCLNNLPDEISIENPQGTYDYEWVLEDGTIISTTDSVTFTTIDFIPDEGTIITVTATDPLNNCSTATDISIQKFEIATIMQDDITVEDLTDNNTITISPQDPNYNVDDYEFALDDGDGGIGPYQDEPFFENVASGIRTLYIRDKFGCNSLEIEVSVIGFRKFFTPNNDGYNDTWHLLGINENFYTTSIIRIYDRFGKIVATINPNSEGWDGYYNSKQLPENDYWFTVQLIDATGNIRDHKGHFSLIRR